MRLNSVMRDAIIRNADKNYREAVPSRMPEDSEELKGLANNRQGDCTRERLQQKFQRCWGRERDAYINAFIIALSTIKTVGDLRDTWPDAADSLLEGIPYEAKNFKIVLPK